MNMISFDTNIQGFYEVYKQHLWIFLLFDFLTERLRHEKFNLSLF